MSTPGTAIPRYRPIAGPAILHQGFRPFFLSAGIWSAAALSLWIMNLAGATTTASAFDAVAWHVHEMLFGFAMAAAAGFLLTAIPNWTGRMPLQGWPLAALWTVWLAGRVAVLVSAEIGAGIAMVIDMAFPLLLLLVVLREIVAGKNWRNLPMVAAVGALLAADLLMHLDALGLALTADVGRRLGIGVFVLLITLVGGRVVPSFTRNWLVKRGETRLPAAFGSIDRAALVLTPLAIGVWVAFPMSDAAAAASLLAAAALAGRLSRWRGALTVAEPLLWILHVGYAWLPVGFVMIALAQFFPATVAAGAAVHGFTVGAMGAMTLAMMTRATLGHTGRPLTAGMGTLLVFVLVIAAAVARTFVFIAPPELYTPAIHVAGAAWIAAFTLYVALYLKPLATRRKRA